MKTLHGLVLAAALSTAAVASAQTSAPGDGPRGSHRGHGGPGRGHPIVRILDVDKNGEVSAAELAGAPAAIRKLDTNADGTVTVDEFHPSRPADAPAPPVGKRGRSPAPGESTNTRAVDPVMLALDANGDRALSPTEIANAATSLAAIDANKDGKLTRDELRPLPPRE